MYSVVIDYCFTNFDLVNRVSFSSFPLGSPPKPVVITTSVFFFLFLLTTSIHDVFNPDSSLSNLTRESQSPTLSLLCLTLLTHPFLLFYSDGSVNA